MQSSSDYATPLVLTGMEKKKKKKLMMIMMMRRRKRRRMTMTMQSNPCLASCGPPHLPTWWSGEGSSVWQPFAPGRESRAEATNECANDKYFTMRTMHAQRIVRTVRRMFTDKSAARVRKFSSVHRESLSLALEASHSTLRLPGLRSLSAITNHGCLGLFGSLSLFPTTL